MIDFIPDEWVEKWKSLSGDFCKRLRVLDRKDTEKWYDILDIARHASDYCVTGIFLGTPSHAKLVIKAKDGKVVEYDPREDGIKPEDITKYIPTGHAYLTGDLNDLFDKGIGFVEVNLENVQNFRQMLDLVSFVDGGYELKGVESLGRIQNDGCNCGPLTLYAAIVGNANNPKYSEKLDWGALARDFGLTREDLVMR